MAIVLDLVRRVIIHFATTTLEKFMLNTKSISTTLVDYRDPKQMALLIEQLNHYAMDDMGGAQPLPEEVKQRLLIDLPHQQQNFSLLAWVGDDCAGMTNCLWGYSTFAAMPLVNIHDLVVHKSYRGLGVSTALLRGVEDHARTRNACKVTLEVLGNNHLAKASYNKFGFKAYELSDGAGKAEFWQKHL
jgi:ribosomal protein S18 acetylase RimI-like enzyme